MKIRKISASYIFTGESGFLKNGVLSLSGDGRVLKITDTDGYLTEEANLEHYNGILCPGFVNAHCHVELSHLRGKIPRNTELPEFIEAVVSGRKEDKNLIQKAIAEADREMRQEGIVAVGDICNTSDSFEIKTRSPVYYHSFVEIFGIAESGAQNIFRNGQNLVHLARQKYSLKANLTPHSAYGLSDTLFSLFRENYNSDNRLLSVHNQESLAENDLICNAKGGLYNLFHKMGLDISSMTPRNKNSLQWLLEQLPSEAQKLMVHNLYTTEQDILESGAEKNNIYWVLCPKSNFHIGGIYPGSYLLKRFPDRVCIGTDSLSSNDRLSILDELISLQNVHPEISLYELLSCATINGAKALGVDKWCGNFEVGKKPGLVLIENVDVLNLRLKQESRVRVL